MKNGFRSAKTSVFLVITLVALCSVTVGVGMCRAAQGPNKAPAVPAKAATPAPAAQPAKPVAPPTVPSLAQIPSIRVLGAGMLEPSAEFKEYYKNVSPELQKQYWALEMVVPTLLNVAKQQAATIDQLAARVVELEKKLAEPAAEAKATETSPPVAEAKKGEGEKK